MTANILDGRLVSKKIKTDVKAGVDARLAANLSAPCLTVILVGDNPASQHYVGHKERACIEMGIESRRLQLPADASLESIQQAIEDCAQDDSVHGILLQLPLPDRSMETALIESIPPIKDVDGFHPFNFGRLAAGQPYLRSCTPYGVMKLLEYYDIPLKGAHVAMVGASAIVGRPMMLECLNAGATVTICHIHTKDLAMQAAQADILIVAIGNAEVIQSNWIKPGAVVVDVGFERDADGNIHGDVPFDSAKEVAGWITPVPGGVGAMTVAMLMHNTLSAAKLQTTQK
jgi:methylenetetrahydrofolate dehydrogenase (NADP+)/methenyltetrahydrofolate cyclohydrolase